VLLGSCVEVSLDTAHIFPIEPDYTLAPA
jgi:hypothetical protein